MQRLFDRYPFYARCSALLLLLLCTALTMLGMPDGLHTYWLSDGALTQVVRAKRTDPSAILAQFERPLLENDWLEVSPVDGGTLLQVHRSQMVTVHLNGESLMTECAAATVGGVLEALGITLDDDDYIHPSVETPMQEGMEIHVIRVEHRELVTETVIPRQTLTVLDLTLGVGETRVDDEGADGLSRTTTYITYENGEVVEHEQVTEVVQPARARRVSSGISHVALEGTTTLEHFQFPQSTATKPPATSKPGGSGSSSGTASYSSGGSAAASGNTITAANGETYHYTKVLACSATAYTTEGFEEKHNASGNIARVGTVAVDPKVIPLGTALYIVTDDGEYIYGYCIAEDTGGAVKGNIVDLFFNTLAECYAFGRRNCTVYVLG